MPPKNKDKKPRNQNKGNRSRRTNRARSSTHNVHIPSERITRITTKTNHKVVEIYPISLSDLVDLSVIGTDVDVRLVGYSISVHFATGNKTETVSIGISHSGPWVRHGPSDGFNQQFLPKSLRNNRVLFTKRLLRQSERQFLNPHQDGPSGTTNYINLKVIDPCGCIPGATAAITFRAHFIRPVIPVSVAFSDAVANDLYEDQDIDGSGATPSSGLQDVPLVIRTLSPGGVIDYDLQKPQSGSTVVYDSKVSGYKPFTVTATGSGKLNFIGEMFFNTDPAALPTYDFQTPYARDGYEGNITY